MENKQVLAYSLVRPVDEDKINHQASQSDPTVEEIEGSQQTLDLLSDLVNSPMPVVDPSKINGFDAMEHIGFELVCKDKHDVTTKTKVIEVDEDTGKALL
eukprot:11474315-Ditylum_brightwellii.AAC.1